MHQFVTTIVTHYSLGNEPTLKLNACRGKQKIWLNQPMNALFVLFAIFRFISFTMGLLDAKLKCFFYSYVDRLGKLSVRYREWLRQYPYADIDIC